MNLNSVISYRFARMALSLSLGLCFSLGLHGQTINLQVVSKEVTKEELQKKT